MLGIHSTAVFEAEGNLSTMDEDSNDDSEVYYMASRKVTERVEVERDELKVKLCKVTKERDYLKKELEEIESDIMKDDLEDLKYKQLQSESDDLKKELLHLRLESKALKDNLENSDRKNIKSTQIKNVCLFCQEVLNPTDFTDLIKFTEDNLEALINDQEGVNDQDVLIGKRVLLVKDSVNGQNDGIDPDNMDKKQPGQEETIQDLENIYNKDIEDFIKNLPKEIAYGNLTQGNHMDTQTHIEDNEIDRHNSYDISGEFPSPIVFDNDDPDITFQYFGEKPKTSLSTESVLRDSIIQHSKLQEFTKTSKIQSDIKNRGFKTEQKKTIGLKEKIKKKKMVTNALKQADNTKSISVVTCHCSGCKKPVGFKCGKCKSCNKSRLKKKCITCTCVNTNKKEKEFEKPLSPRCRVDLKILSNFEMDQHKRNSKTDDFYKSSKWIKIDKQINKLQGRKQKQNDMINMPCLRKRTRQQG